MCSTAKREIYLGSGQLKAHFIVIAKRTLEGTAENLGLDLSLSPLWRGSPKLGSEGQGFSRADGGKADDRTSVRSCNAHVVNSWQVGLDLLLVKAC